MRRLVTAAAGAGLALVAWAATGCGVQSTGVNVAQAEPFSLPGSNTSQAPSQATGTYPMTLYFIPFTSASVHQTTRLVAKPVTGIGDLLEQLKTSTDPALRTWVPEDLQLIPTSHAHQYRVQSQDQLNPAAQEQIACTFSAYWRVHPDKGSEPSVSFILSYESEPTPWNDCAGLLGSAPDQRSVGTMPTGN